MTIRRGNNIIAGCATSSDVAEAVKDQNTTSAIKTWTGTKVQYDALKATPSWYAWVSNGTTYFTQSATPSVGDTIYDNNKQDTGKTISAIESGTISYNDGNDNLYAWTDVGDSNPKTIYTLTTSPTTSETLYKDDGTTLNIWELIGTAGSSMGNGSNISSASSSVISIVFVD